MIAAEVELDEYSSSTDGLPLEVWNNPVAGGLYGRARYFVVRDSAERLRAAWCCPTIPDGSVVREYRILPYASPWVDPQLHPTKRDRAIAALAQMIQSVTNTVNLPLSPEFVDTSGFLFAGFTLSLRHSRVLDELTADVRRSRYLPEVRGHIRTAAKHHKVEVVSVEAFDFERAIVKQSPEALKQRAASAKRLHMMKLALALNAVDVHGLTVGGTFLIRNGNTAISMHSWFDRAVRGVPSLLVDEAIIAAQTAWQIESFDFEGSVLPGIDAFMSTFGARARPYAHLSWSARTSGTEPWTFA